MLNTTDYDPHASFFRSGAAIGTRVSPQNFNPEIENYISNSAKLATEILDPSKFGYTSSDRRIGRVRRRSFFFMPLFIPSPRPAYVYSGGRRPQQNNGPSGALRIIAGIVSAALGGFAIYKVGQTLNHLKDSEEEIKENRAFSGKISAWKHEWEYNLGHAAHENKYLTSLETICKTRNKIFERVRGNAQSNLAIMICLVATGIFGLLGAVFASYPLLALALLGGCASGAAFLFKLGFASSDKRDKRAAEVIENEINLLKGNHFLPTYRAQL